MTPTTKPPAGAPPSPPPAAAAGGSAKAVNVPKLAKAEPKFQPPRLVVTGVEGWGKTTLASYAPNPAMLMARGEDGYVTLLGVNSVPNIDATTFDGWPGLLAFLDNMASQESIPYKTLVFDALGGFERLCHEHVCTRDFKGDWGEKGFVGFQKGFEVALSDWIGFLSRLDRIRAHGVMILLLSHSRVKPFKNPMGPDFDQYVSDVHPKTWDITKKWVDAVFFAKFITVPDKVDGKIKGIGGTSRIMYTRGCDAFNAKNRYGMPTEIEFTDDPTLMWSTLWTALIRKDNNNA